MPAIVATQSMLQEARNAYHQLQMGLSARVVVDGGDGSRVEYTAANKTALYNYITLLEAQLNPTAVGTAPMNGPAQFFF